MTTTERAPFTRFGQTRDCPVTVYVDGQLVDAADGWDAVVWVESDEDWYALSSTPYEGKRVRVVTRPDWLGSPTLPSADERRAPLTRGGETRMCPLRIRCNGKIVEGDEYDRVLVISSAVHLLAWLDPEWRKSRVRYLYRNEWESSPVITE